MLALGGVRPLTGGSKKEGNVTCERMRKLWAGEAVTRTIDGGHEVVVAANQAPIVDGKPEQRMRVGCGSATVDVVLPTDATTHQDSKATCRNVLAGTVPSVTATKPVTATVRLDASDIPKILLR